MEKKYAFSSNRWPVLKKRDTRHIMTLMLISLQGYVTEIILTLEALVENLDMEVRPIDFMRDIFMSTPNLAKDLSGAEARRSVLMAPKQQSSPPQHARSTSYSIQSVTAKVNPGK